MWTAGEGSGYEEVEAEGTEPSLGKGHLAMGPAQQPAL